MGGVDHTGTWNSALGPAAAAGATRGDQGEE